MRERAILLEIAQLCRARVVMIFVSHARVCACVAGRSTGRSWPWYGRNFQSDSPAHACPRVRCCVCVSMYAVVSTRSDWTPSLSVCRNQHKTDLEAIEDAIMYVCMLQSETAYVRTFNLMLKQCEDFYGIFHVGCSRALRVPLLVLDALFAERVCE